MVRYLAIAGDRRRRKQCYRPGILASAERRRIIEPSTCKTWAALSKNAIPWNDRASLVFSYDLTEHGDRLLKSVLKRNKFCYFATMATHGEMWEASTVAILCIS